MRVLQLCLGALVATACGSDPPPAKPAPPPPPGLSDAEAARLTTCVEVLESGNEQRRGAADIARACTPKCDLDIPEKIIADTDQLISFVIGRCARGAERGQSTWTLAERAGSWLADVNKRAPNSHEKLAGRLGELLDEVTVPLLLEAAVEKLYRLPSAANASLPATQIYAVVGAKSVTVGIAGWASFSTSGAKRKVGFGGPFPGKRVRLKKLRSIVTQLHSTVSDDPDATAEARAPLLLVDRKLRVERLARVVKRLERARLGVDRRGLAGEHVVHLNYISKWEGTWLLFRPGRTVVRTTNTTMSIPDSDGAIDWDGVRTSLAKAGGGDLAITPTSSMTVAELTVILDQIKTADSAPGLFFAPAPGLNPVVTLGSIAGDGIASEAARASIELELPALAKCYRAVLESGGSEAALSVRITVGSRGQVRAVEASSELGGKHRRCVERVIKSVVFPRPKRRKPSDLSFALEFRAE